MGIFNFSRYVSKFLDNIQNETQARFIKEAKKKKRNKPDPIIERHRAIEKEIEELKKILKEY